MAEHGVRVVTPDLRQVAARIEAAERVLGSPEPLLKAFGVATVGWIGQTFRVQGRPAWKPLTTWTLAGRREGKGSRSPQVLANTGKLRNSFDYRTTARACIVFTPNPVAVFHQFGTRGPYIIRAKPGKRLALPALGFRDDGRVSGQYTKAGLGRSRATKQGSFLVTTPGRNAPARVTARTGKTIAPYRNVIFRQQVTHPGLPARPMLPTAEQILPTLHRIATGIVDRALGK